MISLDYLAVVVGINCPLWAVISFPYETGIDCLCLCLFCIHFTSGGNLSVSVHTGLVDIFASC